MESTIFKIIGVVLIAQAVSRDWNDWQGVIFGAAVGAYLMALKMRGKK